MCPQTPVYSICVLIPAIYVSSYYYICVIILYVSSYLLCIQGFEEGLSTMRVGMRRSIIIPPVRVLLYVSSYYSDYCMCPHTTQTSICVLILLRLLYMCPHTTQTTIHVSSYYSDYYICAPVLLYARGCEALHHSSSCSMSSMRTHVY